MHRSRLSTFVLDCKTDDLDAAARFWGQALGRAVRPTSPESPRYRALAMRDTEPVMYVQQVTHPSRVHLDIESDDVDAEVRRLSALGAREVERVQTWVVMEAPTGQRFCVVRPQREPLDDTNANVWR